MLDTDVLALFLKGNENTVKFLSQLGQDYFSISVISRLKILQASKKAYISEKLIKSYLENLVELNIDSRVIDEAFKLFRRPGLNLKFEDLLIAASAKYHNKTLISSNKDFKKIFGLRTHILVLQFPPGAKYKEANQAHSKG